MESPIKFHALISVIPLAFFFTVSCSQTSVRLGDTYEWILVENRRQIELENSLSLHPRLYCRDEMEDMITEYSIGRFRDEIRDNSIPVCVSQSLHWAYWSPPPGDSSIMWEGVSKRKLLEITNGEVSVWLISKMFSEEKFFLDNDQPTVLLLQEYFSGDETDVEGSLYARYALAVNLELGNSSGLGTFLAAEGLNGLKWVWREHDKGPPDSSSSTIPRQRSTATSDEGTAVTSSAS